MKIKIYYGRDWDTIEELINAFLQNKKLIELKQNVIRGGFFDSYHFIVITLIYEGVAK